MSKEPSYYRARFAAFGAALTYENSLPESRERQMRISYLRNGFVPDNFLQKTEYEFNVGSGLYRTIPQFIKEFTKNDNSPLTQVELQTLDTWFVVNPEKICGVQKGGSGYSFPVKTIGTKQDIINAIDKTLSNGKQRLPDKEKTIKSKQADWLFIGGYPTGEQYADRSIEVRRDYKKIAFVFTEPQPIWDEKEVAKIKGYYRVKVESNNEKYAELITELKNKYDLPLQQKPAQSKTNLTIYKYKAKAIALKLKLQND
jgi:hypothetical protein